MKKVIALTVITIAGTGAGFAERAASFGPERSVKGAPVVSSAIKSAEAKSSARVPHQSPGLKEAGTSADKKSMSSFMVSDWSDRAGS